MNAKIDELRNMAETLLVSGFNDENVGKKWGEDVRSFFQELSIYHFELERQNAALAASEHDLMESREKYMEFFEDAPVGYVIIDRNGVISQANRTFTDMCVSPCSGDGVIAGRTFSDFICPEHKEIFAAFLEKLSSFAHITSIEVKMIDFQGKPRFATITAGRRKSDVSDFRLTISDITPRKNMEMKLLAAQQREEENNTKKRLFLAHINHELRTPLTSIAGLCEILGSPELLPDTRQEHLATLKEVTFAMKIISDEIMDLSLVEAGAAQIKNEVVDVAKICRENARIAQTAVADKEIDVICATDHLPLLFGDSERIETVVHSIFRHARANVTDGSIRLQGAYEQNPDGSGILRLLLSGNGVSMEDTDFPSDYACDCTGIELFLARQILKFMGGWLSCAASGNLIQVEIPLFKAPQAQDVSARDGILPSGIPKSCLIIDDVNLNVKVLAALMRKIGCIPMVSSSGKEALRILSRTRVDLILTDLWMPEMNGVEFAMNVRQMPEYNNIPIVAVTADVERAENFDMRYFYDTIIKPVKLETIKETIDSLWNKPLAMEAKKNVD